MGKGLSRVLPYLFTFWVKVTCPCLTYLMKEVKQGGLGCWGHLPAGAAARGCCPAPEGRVVHEQIEGGVDGVFVHARWCTPGPSGLEKPQLVRSASPGAAGAEDCLLDREKIRIAKGSPSSS